MNHIKRLVCACCLFVLTTGFPKPGFAAFEYRGGNWPAALANIHVVGADLCQAAWNPALLPDSLAPTLGLSLSRPYAGLDLRAGSFFMGHAAGPYRLIHRAEFLGDETYSEVSIASGTTWSVDDFLDLGLSLNYQRVHLTGIVPKQTMSISVTTAISLGPRIEVGSTLQNIAQISKGLKSQEVFQLGARVKAGPAAVLIALEKEAALPLEACLAAEYTGRSVWHLAMGYRSLSGMLSGGWRIEWGAINFHHVLLWHPQLPPSQGIGLEFSL